MNVSQKTVNTIRILSMDGINKAKSGHPGICLGSAPVMYSLYNNVMHYNAHNPNFFNRDRFVLSAGHGSMMLYSTLHVFGFDVTADDLKNFRQFGSRTPGHPERGVTAGVEVSTGPLGQGIANAVGLAMAEKHLSAVFNRPNYQVVDHYTYVLCGDGCNMEGVSYEAVSLAGTLNLNKLVVIYDKNNITIEGNTDIAFKENVSARFKACGWDTFEVQNGNSTEEITVALERAKRSPHPALVVVNTKIGYGSVLEGSAKIHGSPLGDENTMLLRQNLDYSEPPFTVADDVKTHVVEKISQGEQTEQNWNKLFDEYKKAYPSLADEFTKWLSGNFDGIKNALDGLTFDTTEATRITGFKCINAVASQVPSLFGGSADLTPSNKTNMTDREDFSAENGAGSNVHFGIREHAMGAICNGIACHGGVLPYCSTFFVFSDYVKPAMRMSALMDLPVTYVLTHDSIGVGEDGPTHQPVEQLAMLRTIPNFTVMHPADGNEAKASYLYAFTSKKPCAIVLSRQNLPQLDYNGSDAEKGGYVLCDCDGTPSAILVASGSEVALCVEAHKQLAESGIKTRVVSMPSMEIFERQTDDYKQSVLPREVTKRVAVEAGDSSCWYKYVGLTGKVISMQSFGASSPQGKLFEHFGFTVQNVVDAVTKIL